MRRAGLHPAAAVNHGRRIAGALHRAPLSWRPKRLMGLWIPPPRPKNAPSAASGSPRGRRSFARTASTCRRRRENEFCRQPDIGFARKPRPSATEYGKRKKTAEELAAMIHHDLSQIEGCPKPGFKVTVYCLNPWNCLLTFWRRRWPRPQQGRSASLL